MVYQRYNQVSDFDLAQLTLAQLRVHYRTGINITSGSGRYKSSRYRTGIQTDVGDIELSVWCYLVEQVIQRDNETWLLNALMEWLTEHNFAKDSKKELWIQALELHSMRIFERPEWVDFIDFTDRFCKNSTH